jgi:mono/diheme cytochrome c family protein
LIKLTWIPIAVTLSVLAGCANSGRTDTSPVKQGERTFRVSCAGCHGVDADGLGPIAPILNVTVPDLRRIAARRNGEFPELEIFRIIDGQAELAGHGPRHMPVWGYEFFGDDADDEVAHARATTKVDQVVAYLRSIQR